MVPTRVRNTDKTKRFMTEVTFGLDRIASKVGVRINLHIPSLITQMLACCDYEFMILLVCNRRHLGLRIYILHSLSYCARNRKVSIIQKDVFKTNQNIKVTQLLLTISM